MSNQLSWHPHRRGALIGIGSALLLVTMLSDPGAAQERQSNQCIAAALSSWTRQELWVWKQLCLHRVADLNKSRSFGANTSINERKSWSSQRVLRSSFIEAILTEARYSEKLTNRSIRISGAWFRSPINLEDSSIPFAVRLWKSRFDGSVNLLGADIGGTISFAGSAFRNQLNLNGAKVDSHVFLTNGAKFRRVDLGHADVRGSLVATNSTFEDELHLNSVKVQGHVSLRNGGFKRVDLGHADVSGSLVATNSTFEDELNLNNAKIGGPVFLRDGAKFRRVDLGHADVSGNLDATNSKFQGDLNLDRAQVDGSVLLFESEFAGTVMCSGATIGGVLSLYGNRRHPKWHDSAEINLEGSTVRGVDDAPQAWPHQMKLGGFVIQQTHSQPTPSGSGFIDRDVSWYLNDWLGRDKDYSREAYKQLEGLLRSVGRNRDADRVAMARLDHEYALEDGLLGRLREAVGIVHEATVGYGYQPERALIPIAILILVGAWVARGLPQENLNAKGVCSRLVLSAQRLIPLVSFGQAYTEVDVTSSTVPKWVRRYFYLHATLGYILAAFLVTTLARITTR